MSINDIETDRVTVTITMPDAMFDDLRARSHRRGRTVPDLLLHAVSVDRLVDRPGAKLFVKRGRRRFRVLYP